MMKKYVMKHPVSSLPLRLAATPGFSELTWASSESKPMGSDMLSDARLTSWNHPVVPVKPTPNLTHHHAPRSNKNQKRLDIDEQILI